MRLGRERILIGGESGSGKTYAWLTVCRALSRNKFVVIEPDDGVTRVRDAEFPQVVDVHNLTVMPVINSWMDFHNQVKTVGQWVNANPPQLGPDDWVVTEGLDIITSVIRYEFVDRVYGSGRPAGLGADQTIRRGMADSSWDAIVNRRRTGSPVIEPSDYDGIYTELEKPLRYLSYQMPCHWIGTCAVEQIGGYGDQKELKEYYANMGMPVRFSGYKRIPKMFDTHVVLGKSISTGYTFVVYKDRGGTARGLSGDGVTPAQQKPNRDFYGDYLKAMAGWQ